MDEEAGQRRNTVFMREIIRRLQAFSKLPLQLAEHVINLYARFMDKTTLIWSSNEFPNKTTLYCSDSWFQVSHTFRLARLFRIYRMTQIALKRGATSSQAYLCMQEKHNLWCYYWWQVDVKPKVILWQLLSNDAAGNNTEIMAHRIEKDHV